MKIFGDYQGRRVVVGELENGVFRKKVKLRQKLQVMDAYGFDEDYFSILDSAGCKQIELVEKETENVYRIDFKTLKTKGIWRKIGKFGKRVYLPLKYWQCEEKT